MKRKFEEMAVVITGASSGIGRAAALEFARRGASIVIAARREQALLDLARECNADHRVVVAPADVTDEASMQAVARRAIERFGRIDVWVNNAAVTMFGKFDEVPLDAFRRVIETNVFGYVHGVRAALPYLREQDTGGVIVNVVSPLGRAGAPYTSAYAMSKAAICILGECLRQELHGTNIHVCSVFPSSTDTPIFQQAANFYGRQVKPLSPVHRVESAAEAIVRAAEHPRREIYASADGSAVVWLHDCCPGMYEALARPKVERDHFTNEAAAPSTGNLFEPMPEFATVSGGWRVPKPGQGLRIASAGIKALGAAAALWWVFRMGTKRNGRLLHF